MTPMAQIEVFGRRRSVLVEAVVDTGFDGQVCLPTELAVTLGLELAGTRLVEFADGSQQEIYFAGQVVLMGITQDVEIFLTNAEESLIGTELMKDCRLTIDFPREKVRLAQSRHRR